MIAAARNPKQGSLVALCGLCGLRIAESLSVRPSHFNFTDLTLSVRGKGDVTRIIPVSDEAWEVLFPAVSQAFITGDNPPIIDFKDRFARSLITKLGERAGLSRRVASHDLRATFATAVYNATLDQRLVQELLGHASGNTTEIYIEVALKSKKAAVNKI
jgi:site-specific recombinase XerD